MTSLDGAENLVPTPGFNTQAVQITVSHCTHVTQAYRLSRR